MKIKSTLLLLLAGLPLLASSQTVPEGMASDGVDLYIGLDFNYEWEDETRGTSSGIYRLTAGASEAQLGSIDPLLVGGGVTYHGGKVYVNTYSAADGGEQNIVPVWRVYDLNTGLLETSVEGRDNTEDLTTALAYDPTTDKIYGALNNINGLWLCQIEPSTGEKTIIGRLVNSEANAFSCYAMACNQYGMLFAIYSYYKPGSNDRYLRFARVRTTDGYLADLGDVTCTGMLDGDYMTMMSQRSALVFNQQTGRLFWLACMSSYALGDDYYTPIFEMNINTGVATMLGYLNSGYAVTGAFFAEPITGAPDGVADITYSYSASSADRCTGTLSITAPAVAYDGTALTGELTIVINEGETEVARLTGVMPGATVTTEEQTFAYGGHTYSAYAINAAGTTSPIRDFDVWVGYDVPVNPTNARVTVDGLLLTLTWDAPTSTTGMHGLEVDLDNITYTVLQFNNEAATTDEAWITISNNYPVTTYVQEIPSELYRYTYIVYACYNGVRGGGITSNSQIGGDPLDTPYSTEFESVYDLINYYRLVDNNADGYSWNYTYSYGCYAFYQSSEVNVGDDWMFTPPINYKANHTYRMTVEAMSWYNVNLPSMELTFGNDDEIAAQEVLLTVPQVAYNEDYYTGTDYVVEVTPEADGVYYFGIHATSPAGGYLLCLHSVTIEDLDQSGISNVAAHGQMTVQAGRGTITVANPEGLPVAVYAISGQQVATSTATQLQTTLPAGAYIVKCGSQAQKVIVK